MPDEPRTEPPHNKPGRPFWKKKRWWVLAVVVVFLFWLYFIPRFPFGPLVLYSDLSDDVRSQVIPHERLSSQDTDPYLGNETVPDHLVGAVKRFPDVQSCLVAPEQNKPTPDLRLINWDILRTRHEVELCLWRVFASLGTPDRVAQWMVFHGFETTGPTLTPGIEDQTTVNGNRSYSFQGHVWPTTGFSRFSSLLFFHIRAETLSAQWKGNSLAWVSHRYSIL